MSDIEGLKERLRVLGAMLVHADALSIKPKSPNEVETTCITTAESRILWSALSDASTTITSLQADLDAAREALGPFARVAAMMESLSDGWPDDKPNSEFIPGAWPNWGDFHRALTNLEAQKES